MSRITNYWPAGTDSSGEFIALQPFIFARRRRNIRANGCQRRARDECALPVRPNARSCAAFPFLCIPSSARNIVPGVKVQFRVILKRFLVVIIVCL